MTVIKKIRVAVAVTSVLFAAFLPTAGAKVFEYQCKTKLPMSKVDVVIEPYVLNTDLSKSISELTRIKNDSSHPLANRDIHSLGMLVSSGRVNVQSSISELTRTRYSSKSNSQEALATCSSVSYKVRIGIANPTLYVAREFMPGTCGYHAIHKHEMEHSDILSSMLPAAAEQIKRRVEQEVGTSVLFNPSEALLDFRSKMVLKIADQELEKVSEASAAIDTPEEYKRVLSTCGPEINNIMNFSVRR